MVNANGKLFCLGKERNAWVPDQLTTTEQGQNGPKR